MSSGVRERRRLITLAAITLTLVLSVSCSDVERQHRILSLLFDGVPPLQDGKELETEPGGAATDESTLEYVEPTAQMVAHDAYKERKCGNCHDAERVRNLVEPMPKLCYGCHDDFSQKYQELHGPVASGNCTDCHSPHYARFKYLLNQKGRELCFHCHDISDLKPREGHELTGKKECTQCHDSHGGKDKMFLIKQGQ